MSTSEDLITLDDLLRSKLDIFTVAKLAEDIREDLESDRKTALFWGAGCSVSAKIPAAGGFVDHIKKKFKPAVRRCEGDPNFQNLMAALDPLERRDVIRELTSGKHLNWSHILAIWLMKVGVVDIIYTLNFDPLLLDACSMVGFHVPVYDFGATPLDRPEKLQTPAIVYLHGQSHGFRQRIVPKDSEPDHYEMLFRHAKEKQQRWIVVGYSGKNDSIFPLFRHAPFMGGIFWVPRKIAKGEEEFLSVSEQVMELLTNKQRSVSTIPADDSDTFMIELAEHLGHFPPFLFLKPARQLADQVAKGEALRFGDTSFVGFANVLLDRTRKAADDAEDTLLLEEFFGAARNPDRLLRLCDRARPIVTPAFRKMAAQLLIAEADRSQVNGGIPLGMEAAYKAQPDFDDGGVTLKQLKLALSLLEQAFGLDESRVELAARSKSLAEIVQKAESVSPPDPTTPLPAADDSALAESQTRAEELAGVMAVPSAPYALSHLESAGG